MDTSKDKKKLTVTKSKLENNIRGMKNLHYILRKG